MIGFDQDSGRLGRSGDDAASSLQELGRPWSFPEAPDSPCVALVRTIESDVIPRLLLAHRIGPSRSPARKAPESTGAGDIAAFAHCVLTQDDATLQTQVGALTARGMAVDAIFLELLAPAARRLGDFWCSDTCSFTDVTLATYKLRTLMRRLGDADGGGVDQAVVGARVLLAAVPGSQHTFGIQMVGEFFRRSGWDAICLAGATARDIVEAVRRERFAAIGLSASRESETPKLAPLIAAIRKASRNRSIAVLVGGPFFCENPDEALRIGADATASDGRDAVIQAKRLVTAMKRH